MRDDWKTSPRLRRGMIALAGLGLVWLLFFAPGSMFPRLGSRGSLIKAKLRAEDPGIEAQIWFRPAGPHRASWLVPSALRRGPGPLYRLQVVAGPGENTRKYRLAAASIAARDGREYPIQLTISGDVDAAAQWQTATKLEGRTLATIYDSITDREDGLDATADLSGALLTLDFELEEAGGPRRAELDYELAVRSNFERLLGLE